MENNATRLLRRIDASPSSFHAIHTIKQELCRHGFLPLEESRPWALSPGTGYFVTRNQSSLVAFVVPKAEFVGFQIVASHSDAPTFKLKENPQIEVKGHYIQLNTERYGGMLCSTWLDRPLSLAGRVVVKDGDTIQSRLVKLDRDLLLIPNLAIHMNRKANDGMEYNPQVDMLPLYGGMDVKDTLMPLVAESCGVAPGDILSHDLYLYNRMEGRVWGLHDEWISSPRLDDLECAFTSLDAFLDSRNPESVRVLGVFDNEEVGSSTKQGAAGTLLRDTLSRVNRAFGRGEEELDAALACSFMVSADNAHALHPNHPDKSDPTNAVYPNEGIVVKFSANQKYTTDGVSAAVFREICGSKGVKVQSFVNRSDLAGGSTLGNISNTKVSINTVDIGLAQFAMHSSYESAGAKDVDAMIAALGAFYSCTVHTQGDGSYRLVHHAAPAGGEELG